MRKFSQIFISLFLFCFILNANAIQISVRAMSDKVFALGFLANGESHGGLGNYYTKDDAPVGNYTFGVRADGQDITCYTRQGSMSIPLKESSMAVLNFDGKKCRVHVYPVYDRG